jgi:hypothetical protein
MERPRCTALRVNGEPCGSFAIRDGLCQVHLLSPEERKAQAARAGRGNRTPEVPVTYTIKKMIVQAVADVFTGEWSPAEAAALLGENEAECDELLAILDQIESGRHPAQSWTGRPSRGELDALVAQRSGPGSDPNLHVA